MHSQPLRRPMVLTLVAQPSLGRGGCARLHQALRHRLHFARQRTKHVQLRLVFVRVRASMAQAYSPQPFHHPGHRLHQKPAHHQQRHAHNQHHEGRDPQEAPLPNRRALRANESRIFQNHQNARQPPAGIQRYRLLQPLPVWIVAERSRVDPLLDGFVHRTRRKFLEDFAGTGKGEHPSIRVIHGQPQRLIPCAQLRKLGRHIPNLPLGHNRLQIQLQAPA